MIATVLRTISLFIFTLICFRAMGFRALGDMEPYDFVIVLAIAEILGAPLSDPQMNPWTAVIAIAMLTILQIVLSFLGLKNKVFRKIVEGKPLAVIKNGKILRQNLKSARFSMDDLNEELRVRGISSPSDVKEAYLEPSGRFSAILKKESEAITPRFLKMPSSYVLINQGIIDFEELEKTPLTTEDLEGRLRSANITDLSKVESAILDSKGNFIVQVLLIKK